MDDTVETMEKLLKTKEGRDSIVKVGDAVSHLDLTVTSDSNDDKDQSVANDTPEITAAKAKVAELNAEGSNATEDEKSAAQKALHDLLAAGKIPGPDAAAGEGENAVKIDGEVATLVIPEGQKMDIDGKYGPADDNTFKFSTIEELNDARTTQEPQLKTLTKEEIEALNATGGRRRTRRRHKKGDKKSRRQSKKGGKKHRKSAKKGSSKSKRSRRYSSRK